MKLMNSKIYMLLLLGLFAFSACEDDDIKLIEPNHQTIMTSEMDYENTVEVNGAISFGDVSQGVESRLWTFPESGVDILGSENDLTSEEAIVKAVFTEVGEHEVELHQVFKGPAYVGTEVKGKELDTTIIVTVLGPVSVDMQAFFINEDGTTGAALTLADGAENEVTASKSVRFTYSVDGLPTNFTWSFDGGDPEVFTGDDEQVDVKYKRIGTYGVNLIASRARPGGADTIAFENLIKVIPSTDPVTLDEVVEKEGNIALVFSREMDPTTFSASDFAVTIENNGTTLTPAVASMSLDPNEGNIVLLTLDNETLYNDDVVSVSYTPGALSTQDGVQADAFADMRMGFDKVNLLKTQSDYDYSFENSFETNWPYLWWGAPWDGYSLTISDAQAMEGSKSAYIELNPGGGMIIGHRNAEGTDLTFPVEKDQDYEIGVWVYVESVGSTAPGDNQPNIRFYWSPETNWGVGDNPGFPLDFKTGEWVYSSIFVKMGHSGDTRFMIRGYNELNPEAVKFYMDNISVSEVSLRP